jgi:thiol-disulfide isomerase/thioredoxin
MRNVLVLAVVLPMLLIGCKTTKPVLAKNQESAGTSVPVTEAAPTEVNFSDQATWLLGYFNLAQLTREPYSVWFTKGFDEYIPGSEALNKLLDKDKSGLTIKVVMGTWCPDSRREVPRFMKVLDIWQFPASQVTLIGVDNAKLSPVGEYNKLDIVRVPTFIIYKNNIEMGRIIENPVTSLEQDIVNILTRNEQ